MEQKILKQFLYHKKLKFNEIEKALGIRSNKLNYHLQKLVQKEILIKKGSTYELAETAEHIIPYLSDKKQVLPVLLIHLGNQEKAFLIRRTKRPYNGKLSLPGGRLVIGESIEEGTKRIMKEKFNVEVELKKINSISLEHIQKKDKTIYSFILLYLNAVTKQDLDLIDLKKNKEEIVESDYRLICEDFKKKVNLKTIFSY